MVPKVITPMPIRLTINTNTGSHDCYSEDYWITVAINLLVFVFLLFVARLCAVYMAKFDVNVT